MLRSIGEAIVIMAFLITAWAYLEIGCRAVHGDRACESSYQSDDQ